MKSDFKPLVGHRFEFRGDWGSVASQVQVLEENKTLSYTWSAMGLESLVTWTLTPTNRGTLLRMEQAGFRADQEQAYQGAKPTAGRSSSRICSSCWSARMTSPSEAHRRANRRAGRLARGAARAAARAGERSRSASRRDMEVARRPGVGARRHPVHRGDLQERREDDLRQGAALEDPAGLFNSSLEGNVRRAIDFREGEKIKTAALKALIRAAVKLNTSKAKR